MSDLTVASTTDTQSAIDQAAGVTTKEEVPEQQEGEETEPKAAEAQEQEKAKPKSAYQKRIDTLVKQRSQAQAEVEDLKARLLKLEQSTRQTPVLEEAPPKEAVTSQDDPEPKEDDPRWTSYKDFVKAQAQWEIRQQLKEMERQKQEEAAKAKAEEDRMAVRSAYDHRLDEARERYEDFDDVAFKDIPVYEGVSAIIMQHPAGPDLQYYLGKNPKVARELTEMPVEMAMARAGSIADQLSVEESQEPTSEGIEKGEPSAPKRKAAPPAPIRPVGGSATKSSVPLDELPYQDYVKIRTQQEKNRFRR
jgi:hypothetical protein